MAEFYVDFHCHPTLRALNTSPVNANRNIWDKTFNINLNSSIGRWARIQTREIAKESQTNLYAYANNKTRVIFDSLYPVEKGWLKFRKMPSYIVGDRAIEEIMLVTFGIERHRLQRLKCHNSYFEELQESYDFLKNGQGCSPDGNFCYKLVSNFSQLQKILKKEPNTLAIVVNIEGAHAFECGNNSTLRLTNKEHKKLLINNIGETKLWEFPPFSVNLAHHFWNQLCGHAKSLKTPIHLVFNQDFGLNLGMNDLGWVVIEELLGRKNGKRVFIDIKHMSIEARQEYYKFIVRHNNLYPDDRIPIICSHTGVNGFETMNESVRVKDTMKKLRGSYFNNWSINLSAEEIRIIYASGGMIGLMMDKGLLGGPETVRAIGFIKEPERKRNAFIKLFLDNVFFIVKSVGEKSAWDIITLGSDYDGLITHIDEYENAGRIPSLIQNLSNYLNITGYRKELWYGMPPEVLMSKLFSTNLYEFLKVNFK